MCGCMVWWLGVWGLRWILGIEPSFGFKFGWIGKHDWVAGDEVVVCVDDGVFGDQVAIVHVVNEGDL